MTGGAAGSAGAVPVVDGAGATGGTDAGAEELGAGPLAEAAGDVWDVGAGVFTGVALEPELAGAVGEVEV